MHLKEDNYPHKSKLACTKANDTQLYHNKAADINITPILPEIKLAFTPSEYI